MDDVPAFETLRELALALPGTEEGTSYGTPVFRVRRRFLGRMLEDGETFVVKVDPREREALCAMDPHTFFVTPHYQDYPMLLVRLASVDPEELEGLLVEAWRAAAPKGQVAAYDAEHPPPP